MGNTRKRKRGQKVGRKKTRRYRRILERLFNNRYQRLLVHIRKLTSNDDDARDILQQVFERIWTSVPNPALIEHFDAYFKQIANNLYNDELRRRKRRNEVPLDQALPSDRSNGHPKTEPRILDLLTAIEAVELAAGNATKKKDSVQKSLLRIALDLEGYTSAEIANILDEPKNHTTMMKRKTRRIVEKTLKKK